MFRYMKREYLATFLNEGKVRVGTLYDFRKSEHGRGIADGKEGWKQVSHRIETGVFKLGDPIDPTNPDAVWVESCVSGFKPGTGPRITMTGTVLVRNNEAPDCYILCSSSKGSTDTMAEFEGADSCIEIFDTDGFFACLTESLKKIIGEATYEGLHSVVYRQRTESWNKVDFGISPALIKAPEYSDQYEERAIWKPVAQKIIKAEFVQDLRLPTFCRVVAF